MTLLLDRATIGSLLDMGETIELMRGAFRGLGDHSIQQGRHTVVPSPDPYGPAIIPMVATSGPYCSVKILADVPSNRDRDLPTQQSLLLLLDGVTGSSLAVLHGGALTRTRTAATTAVATDLLSRSDSSVLGLVGSGQLAAAHVEAIRLVRPITSVVLWSRTAESASKLAQQLADFDDLKIDVVQSPQEVAALADVVCTLTPSVQPILNGAWLRPGTHVNVVGAPPRPGFRELDSAGFLRSRVVVDDRDAAFGLDELTCAFAEGLDPEDVASLDEALLVSGTRTSDEITVFKSVGLAAQDLVTAAWLYERAVRNGRGREVAFNA